jgi:hypothetical protein
MNKSFIDQLIAFLATPFGLIGVAAGLLMLFKASRDRPTGWLLFSFCCFAASLGTFKSQYVATPPLVFPLEQMRAAGRPLAIVLLILLVLLALQTHNNWRRWILPQAVKYLMFVQFIIFAKTIMYGSQEFAILSAITFAGVIYMMKMGPGRWIDSDENFYLAVRSIAIVGLIFVIANGYQYLVNSQAIRIVQGRFMGTTGNPQAAGLLLAAIIPCLMFIIQSSPAWNFVKSSWVAVLIVIFYFLLLTGSRTGLLMGAASILLFYRNNGQAWFKISVGLLVLAMLIVPFLQPDTLSASSTGIDASVSDRFSSTENTRESAWFWMWNSFSNNILFGAPLQGDRMGYGESSWLATAANLGLLGFIPMALVGLESVKLMWQLNKLSNRNSYYFFQCSTVIAGLGGTLVGSFFEAFLLGNITFSLFAFLMYLIMGAYLLEVDMFRTYHARFEAEVVEQPGVYQ